MNSEERTRRLLALDEKMLIAAEKAVDRLIHGLDDPRTPPTATNGLIVAALRGNGLMDRAPDADKILEPHEMTADQLQQNITRLRREAADRSRPIIDGSAARIESQPAESGVFG
jgi:hypothetical protein